MVFQRVGMMIFKAGKDGFDHKCLFSPDSSRRDLIFDYIIFKKFSRPIPGGEGVGPGSEEGGN
jgi:hypothetical protein